MFIVPMNHKSFGSSNASSGRYSVRTCSSRFYLSLEDDLMRLFGGTQVSGLMERLKVDDSLPLEVRLVGNMIEGSQHRVEGANYDVRKHLLEYDDVLNKQRAQIYSQRDRIFIKEDLTDAILDRLDQT